MMMMMMMMTMMTTTTLSDSHPLRTPRNTATLYCKNNIFFSLCHTFRPNVPSSGFA
jgi:hypothetical protein